MRGPIDYIIVGFSGNKFTGKIIEELKAAVSSKTISVLDMAVVAKNEEGEVSSIEVSQSKDPAIQGLAEVKSGETPLIKPEDVTEIGEILEPSSAAGLLIIEQLWAKGLKQAIIDARGTLLAEGRIHPEAEQELNLVGA